MSSSGKNQWFKYHIKQVKTSTSKRDCASTWYVELQFALQVLSDSYPSVVVRGNLFEVYYIIPGGSVAVRVEVKLVSA